MFIKAIFVQKLSELQQRPVSYSPSTEAQTATSRNHELLYTSSQNASLSRVVECCKGSQNSSFSGITAPKTLTQTAIFLERRGEA
jgi:hypothetical protein